MMNNYYQITLLGKNMVPSDREFHLVQNQLIVGSGWTKLKSSREISTYCRYLELIKYLTFVFNFFLHFNFFRFYH
jgi:hypothetical protein